MQNLTQQVVVRLDEDLYASLKEVGKKEDRNLAQVMRRALREYVANHG